MSAALNPVLIIGYNREDFIIDLIKKVSGSNQPIFVWLDGPLNSEDLMSINTISRVKQFIDNELDPLTDLRLKTNQKNLGCRQSLPNAVSWVLKDFETVIVLEDDIMPAAGFFEYMNWALEQFKNESSVHHINAWTPLAGMDESIISIYRSRHVFAWGWGTWRDRWCNLDLNLASYNNDEMIRHLPGLKKYRLGVTFEKNWKVKLNRCVLGYNTWDYQWVYSVWKNNGSSIVPSVSLIENIGFDGRATHTKVRPNWLDKALFNSDYKAQDFMEDLNFARSIKLDLSIDSKIYGIHKLMSIAFLKTVVNKITKSFSKK